MGSPPAGKLATWCLGWWTISPPLRNSGTGTKSARSVTEAAPLMGGCQSCSRSLWGSRNRGLPAGKVCEHPREAMETGERIRRGKGAGPSAWTACSWLPLRPGLLLFPEFPLSYILLQHFITKNFKLTVKMEVQSNKCPYILHCY